MRTKVTTSRTSNATNHAAQSEEPRMSTLTPVEKEKLATWLDKNMRPFTVAAAPLSRKRKRDLPPPLVEQGLLDERLHVQYEVKPKAKWDALRKFKKFTISNESICVGECILVKHDDREDVRIDLEDQWKAQVLEVKALDSEHVYVRVAWLNRPEDLDSGRKSYHGRHELIPSNQMDVIDAMTVNGKFSVIRWDDTDEQSLTIADDQYFWRQTYDCVSTRTFSKLHPICIDAMPQNPDEMIVQCSNEECRMWLHLKCIAEQAVESAASEHSSPSKKKAGRVKATERDSPAQAEAQKGSFSSAVYIVGTQTNANGVAAEDGEAEGATNGKDVELKSEIIITDADGNKYTQPVRCLKCDTEIADN